MASLSEDLSGANGHSIQTSRSSMQGVRNVVVTGALETTQLHCERPGGLVGNSLEAYEVSNRRHLHVFCRAVGECCHDWRREQRAILFGWCGKMRRGSDRRKEKGPRASLAST